MIPWHHLILDTQVQLLVRAYQVRGHHVAELDPLGILDTDLADVRPPELELSRYGFTERDLDKDITLGPGILPHFATEENKTMKLRDIIKTLKRIYCASVAIFSNSNDQMVEQVDTLVFNTFTFPTRSNVTGLESVLRPANPGTIPSRRSA